MKDYCKQQWNGLAQRSFNRIASILFYTIGAIAWVYCFWLIFIQLGGK